MNLIHTEVITPVLGKLIQTILPSQLLPGTIALNQEKQTVRTQTTAWWHNQQSIG